MFTFRVCYTQVTSLIRILFLVTAVLLPLPKAFGEEKNIFFLHTYSDQFPWRAQFNTAIREGLKERPDWNYYSETMDTVRLGESMSPDDWRQYIARKYAGVSFDAVLADSIHASEFIDSYGKDLFGEIPKVIFTHRDHTEKPLTCYFNNEQDEAVLGTFELAVRDNPNRKQFVIVEYNSPLYKKHNSDIQDIADANGISVSVLNNFTLSGLVDSIRALDGDEIIFYFLVRRDNSGESFIPRDVLKEIIEVSPAPVYTFWSTLIGTGIVGGVMVDGYTSAMEMFRALDDYFREGRFRNDYTTQSTFIDWKRAKTFGVHLDTHAENTVFINRPRPLIIRYSRPIIISLLVIAAFSLFSRYQKTRANRELQISNSRLDSEKEQLKVTLEGMAEGLITTDNTLRITEYNSYAEVLTGWKREEVLGKNIAEILPVVDETLRPVPFYERQIDEDTLGLEQLYYRKKDGTRRDLVIRKAELHTREDKVSGLVFVFQDDTENRMLMNEIQKNEKLRSIGILAGGIAHDFNNLLAGIYGHVELASLICEPGSEIEEHLKSTMASFDRAKKLAGQLLTFSKGNTPTKELVSVASLIQDCVNFVFSGKKVSPIVTIEPDLWFSEVAKTQIEQVLENLMLNAIQSLDKKGGIYIEAVNRELKASETGRKKVPGRYVQIAIRDDGKGIPPEEIHKIFDPFYTTKEMGTGLGLTTTYSIVSRHGGYIDVNSKVGSGTTFEIYLPAVLQRLSPSPSPQESRSKSRSRGTVLFMDDEPVLLGLAEKILKKEGFEVVIASEGREAIALCKDLLLKKKMISAIILDLTVPDGMGGLEAAKELKPLLPESVPIIAASGYSSDDAISDPAHAGFTDGIAKPFLREDLLKILEKYSDQGGQSDLEWMV